MSARLRVAFNGSALLSPLTGVGQYAKSLAEELLATGELEMQFFYAAAWSPEVRTAPVKNIGKVKEVIKKLVPQPYRVSRALQNWRFGLGIKAHRPELYHEPNFLPFNFDGPTVVTAHDLSWIRYPQTHPAERVEVMNRLFPRALETAAHVITDAAFVRDEIIAEFGVAPDRITSVPLGAREIFHPRSPDDCQAVLAERGLEYRGFVLCVGTLEPRKNLELVIRAYAAMPESYRARRPLVLVGMKGWLTSGLESLMQPLVAAGQIRPQGYTSDADLAVLYAAAQVLVYPSLYEGFGLPPLEAMASGTPVIVSNRSTLPEVVGEAGVQLDAADESGLREALRRMDEDPAWWNARAVASLAQARQFSWARCARETLAVYRKVLGRA
ncbi:MAG TPA: glycosyltransferase family 1 protein [Burkholderiaceae bacterium]|nr:glycosyltransferase family 1 protein [Burkholderiaceae bacterium]